MCNDTSPAHRDAPPIASNETQEVRLRRTTCDNECAAICLLFTVGASEIEPPTLLGQHGHSKRAANVACMFDTSPAHRGVAPPIASNEAHETARHYGRAATMNHPVLPATVDASKLEPHILKGQGHNERAANIAYLKSVCKFKSTYGGVHTKRDKKQHAIYCVATEMQNEGRLFLRRAADGSFVPLTEKEKNEKIGKALNHAYTQSA